MVSAFSPTEPPPKVYCVDDEYQRGGRDRADEIAGKGDRPSSASTARVVTFPLAQAITSMLLPVNNSAPPTITRMRPTQKTIPVSSRMTP